MALSPLDKQQSTSWPTYSRESRATGAAMEEREFGSSDDLQLPKATVQKIVSEILEQLGQGQSADKTFRDTLGETAVEFVTLISSEANEISEREQKKTIGTEHIVSALKELGFENYVGPVVDAADEHKKSMATREKKQTKAQQSGLSEEELLAQQQELFRSATDKFHQAPETSEG